MHYHENHPNPKSPCICNRCTEITPSSQPQEAVEGEQMLIFQALLPMLEQICSPADSAFRVIIRCLQSSNPASSTSSTAASTNNGTICIGAYKCISAEYEWDYKHVTPTTAEYALDCKCVSAEYAWECKGVGYCEVLCICNNYMLL